jgi:hypothetical protein
MPAFAGMTVRHRNLHPLVTPAKAGVRALAEFHVAVSMDASLRWHDGEASKASSSRHPSEGWGPSKLAEFHVAISMDASLRWHDGETSGLVAFQVLRTPL